MLVKRRVVTGTCASMAAVADATPSSDADTGSLARDTCLRVVGLSMNVEFVGKSEIAEQVT